MAPIFFDVESSGLLDDWIDYTSVPYRLKPGYKVHVICAKHKGVKYKWTANNLHEFEAFWQAHKEDMWVSHNGLGFDDLCLLLALDVPVRTAFDTLVASKVLFPDRPGGHSLESWGKRVGLEKMDFRQALIEAGALVPDAPKGAEFLEYHPLMEDYCETDVDVLEKTFAALQQEMGSHDWSQALNLEFAIARSQTLASHRGFKFDVAKAEAAVRDLDSKIAELEAAIEPLLPPKPLGKTALAAVTPPSKAYKKDGTLTTHMANFMERHGLKEVPAVGVPLRFEEPASLADHGHIKQWLLSIGWEPESWKEKDLSIDARKRPLPDDKYEATVDRYIAATLGSPYEAHRLEYLGVSAKGLKAHLMKRKLGKPMRVLGMPTFTVGVEKETCKGLLALGDKFPFAKEVALYYTYKHRRAMLLGGGVDVDEDEADFDRGLLAHVRADGRIPTPADTCAAASSRFKHRVVTNIPRVTSVYGEQMRELFGVESDCWLLGFDFASLEGRIEGCYTWKYDSEDKTYAKSLSQDKPHDTHTLLAGKISESLGREFSRSSAKGLKYATTYGAQVNKIAKMLSVDVETAQEVMDAFWEAAKPLALLKDRVRKFWETKGRKQYIIGIDGRLLRPRSAHSLVNLLFQSAGVYCAKLTVVKLEQKLAAAGLMQDWFTQQRKKTYCQVITNVHDESQMEVTKDLVKWHVLKEGETKPANASAIVEAKGKQYYALSPVADMLLEAVAEVNKELDLKIPLTVEWGCGNNWKDTH